MNTLVFEKTEHGEVPIDVYHKLANDRIFFINGEIDENVASDIAASLLVKDSEDQEKKITLFLNSHGGDIRNCFMILDIMKMISAPIETVCFGGVTDGAALILASGTKGMRFITKNSSVDFCQLSHDSMRYGDLTEAKSRLDRSISDNKRMMEIVSICTSKSIKEVSFKFDRRIFMNASQAINFGFADHLTKSKKK